MSDKPVASRKKKLAIGLLFLVLVSILGLVSILNINACVKSSVKDKIITVDETALLNSDCILILGAGVWSGGRPSYMLEDRLLQGIDLYENGASDRLLMSGDHSRKEYDEVNVMKQFAIDNTK
jgi:SanA protein